VNDEPVSEEEYLRRERERETNERFEFIEGWVIRMPGGSEEHQIIQRNLTGELRERLRGTEYRAIPSGMKVRLPNDHGEFAYPDVVVYRKGALFEGENNDVLAHPMVIAEVLSPSTSSYDAGEKFRRFRRLDSLHEYVLIDQDAPYVEQYVRQESGDWLLHEINDLAATLTLSAVDAELPLTEMYLDVFEG
jgi:Uma2 family endonuclease